MPWYNAVTGEHVYSPSDDIKQKDELIYKPSIYVKEELPTWSEVYEEFYLGKQFSYDPNNPDDQTIDTYWKIPHKKFLIATACNQFNKMLFEDGLKDQIIAELNSKLLYEISGLQFICGNNMSDIKFMNRYSDNYKDAFEKIIEIYTIPLPTGKENPFIKSNYNRININNLDGNISIHPIMKVYDTNIGTVITSPLSYTNIFNTIMEVIIKQFRDYFNGDIGWKDDNGNLIEGDPGCRNCTGAGYYTT